MTPADAEAALSALRAALRDMQGMAELHELALSRYRDADDIADAARDIATVAQTVERTAREAQRVLAGLRVGA